jgi:hypothetical protein
LNPKSGSPILLLEDLFLDFTSDLDQVLIVPLIIEKADASPCTVIAFPK